MKYLVTVFVFCIYFDLPAQTGKKYQVNPGEKIYDVIPKNDIYKYPEFTDGVVLLRNGTFGNGRLNYNSLLGEMQFIDPKGDTLSLADEKNISLITIKKDTFYYVDGCTELMANYGEIKLAARRVFSFSNRTKAGGLNQSGSGEIETYTTYSSKQSYKDITITETLTFSEHVFYYFGDRYNHFKVASKKNLFMIYGKKDTEISKYLDQNPVNFRNEENLKKLCSFLQTL